MRTACVSFHPSPLGGEVHERRSIVEEMVHGGFQQLCAGVPIVLCPPPDEKELLLELKCITENTNDIWRYSPDLLFPNLSPKVSLNGCSIERHGFSVDTLSGRSFLFIHIRATIEDAKSCRLLNEQLSSFKQHIILSLQLPVLSHHIAAAQTTCTSLSSAALRGEVMKWQRYATPLLETALAEFQRLLLATDKEFKTIRTVNHLLKLVRSHLYLKQKHVLQNGSRGPGARLFYRIFRSKLQFPFGAKDVLSLVISLNSLSPYERFDHKHILLACKRCLPSLEIVPRSFYAYRYAEEPRLSLYLEVERWQP
jgi:hypothetical protein